MMSDCENCVSGKYQSQNGKPFTTCKTCTVGKKFTTTTTVCETCGPGKYQNQNTAVNAVCTECQLGFASLATEASTCQSCGEGKYAGTKGLSTCSSCGTGTAADNPKAAKCQACIAGTFQEKNPSTVYGCKVCPGGYYISSTSSNKCSKCDMGLYLPDVDIAANHNSVANCQECGIRTFNPFEGQSSCRACEGNIDRTGLSTW